MSEEWTQPELPFGDELPPSDQFKLRDFTGCALIVCVGGCHSAIVTRFDPKPAIRAAVVVLNGPQAGDVYDDVLIFNTRPVRTLRRVPGRAFVAHVDVDNSTSNPSVVLLDPSADEMSLAADWHNAHPDEVNALVKAAVAGFEEMESKLSAPMPQQRQQQAAQQRSLPPSSPPTGPNYGRTAPATTNQEPGPPPPAKSAQLPTGQPFDAVPPTEPGDEEPPF